LTKGHLGEAEFEIRLFRAAQPALPEHHRDGKSREGAEMPEKGVGADEL